MRRVTLDQAAGRKIDRRFLRVPPLAEFVWEAFWHLEQSRQTHGYGPQAFTYQEIEAWTRLTGETLRLWEVEAIMTMDVARRAALAPPEQPNPSQGPGPQMRRVVSAGNVSAAMALVDSWGKGRGF